MSTPVRLSVPALSEHVRIARLTAASLAADAGFDVDDVDDVRVAVNELYALLIGETEAAGASIDLTLSVDGAPPVLVVEGKRTFDGAAPSDVAADDIARSMLAVIVDAHELSQSGATRRFRMEKRSGAAR